MSLKTRKLIATLSIVGVICLSSIGAISVMPHAHGEDFNHSQHETCPIHQLGSFAVDAQQGLIALWAGFVFLCFLSIVQEKISFYPKIFHHHLRAPPVVSIS